MNISEFQQRISRAGKTVIVDVWAPWCVPCRATKPILEKLAKEYEGQIEFLPVNADNSRELLAHFQIAGIPTVLALREGNLVSRVTGARNEAGYRLLFESLAEGKEVKLPMPLFDRLLRLGTGLFLMVIGLYTGSWMAGIIGGLLAFFGVYDRCPVWRALMGMVQRR